MSIKHLEHTAVQKALGERGGVVALVCAHLQFLTEARVQTLCEQHASVLIKRVHHMLILAMIGYHSTYGSIAGHGIHHMNYRGKQHLHIQKSQPRQ